MVSLIILFCSLVFYGISWYCWLQIRARQSSRAKDRLLGEQEYQKLLNEVDKQRKLLNEQSLMKSHLQEEIELLKNNEMLLKLKAESSFAEIQQEYQEKEDNLNIQWEEQCKKVESLKSTISAMTAAIQREQNKKLQQEKHKILLSMDAVREIKILQSIEDKLSDPRPVRMVIWTGYCSKPVKEMCVRVLGKDVTTGIYKITNLLNGLCYIGQAVDVKKRWSEHIKCGLGIDTPAGNKLYAAMRQDGINNFSFELLEQCPQEELNRKEKFYIETFDSCDCGYNSNKGVNR